MRSLDSKRSRQWKTWEDQKSIKKMKLKQETRRLKKKEVLRMFENPHQSTFSLELLRESLVYLLLQAFFAQSLNMKFSILNSQMNM